MTPVYQVVMEDGRGDCLRACIASILDLDVLDVPNFIEDKERHPVHEAARQWLKTRGKGMVSVAFRSAEDAAGAYVGYDPSPLVLIGESHRLASDGSRKRHAVVGVADGYGFRIIHDPHPSGLGLFGEAEQAVWIL